MASKEMRINITFKTKEKDLYDFLKKQRSQGVYIKDAIDFYRQHHDQQNNFTSNDSNNDQNTEINDLLNF